MQEAVQRIERELGPIHVLVNNAGVDVIQPFVDSTEDTWQRLVQINLLGHRSLYPRGS